MKTAENIFIYIAVMALVTYLIRMLPLVIFRKKIENRFIRSFLYYIPMTFPAVFSSTGSVWSAVAGLIVALLLAFFEKGLLTVALSSCVAVFVIEFLIKIIS